MSTLSNFLRSVVEKHPLANDGLNYSDWILKVNIVLRLENLLHILEGNCPEEIEKGKPTDEENKNQNNWNDQQRTVQTLILASIGNQLQRKFFDTPAKEIVAQLEMMFTDSARKERYKTTIALKTCKMMEGEYVSVHFLKVQGYLEKLEKLKSPIPEDIILGSLPYFYKNFIMHYHMREKSMTMNEIYNALKTALNLTNSGTGTKFCTEILFDLSPVSLLCGFLEMMKPTRSTNRRDVDQEVNEHTAQVSF